jgi:hypothetical protein
MCRPVTAAIVFNAVIVITHIPGVVTASVDNGPLHYSLHFAVVIASLLMWMPVVGPFPELQIGPLAKCIYLFIQSLVPTIPAAWLTFAEGAVYETYDSPCGSGACRSARPAARRRDHEDRWRDLPVDRSSSTSSSSASPPATTRRTTAATGAASDPRRRTHRRPRATDSATSR